MTQSTAKLTCPLALHGWASDNYTLASGPPAVLINPEADALTLLSWGFGQLQQCTAVLDAVSIARRAAPEGSAPALGAVLHFAAQSQSVLQAGIEKLHAQALAAATGQADRAVVQE
ncbi:MAG: hypothetical protein J0H69_01390 [Burkholderiales bacterium]|jgi:hypothetical protein|nr:hypothetical protein [Burkholderiales bacterium]